MSTQMKLSLLQLLDRKFAARFRRADLTAMGSEAIIAKLFDKGILLMGEQPDTAECPLGMHEGDGIVPVTDDGNARLTGFCPEHEKQFQVPVKEAEWVQFTPKKWVQAIRDANGLIDDPVTGKSGIIFAGTYRTNNRKAGIVILSTLSQGEPQDFKPRTADLTDFLCVMLDDSQPPLEEHRAYIPGNKAFGEDLVTLNRATLDTALSSLKKKAIEGCFFKFSSGSKTPEQLPESDYPKAISPSEIRKYDLVLSVPSRKAWRSGKEIKQMAQDKKDGRKKQKSSLSRKGILLIAEYLRRPLTPLSPYKTGPYFGESHSGEKKTAQTMLLNMIATLKLKEVLGMTTNPSGTSGDGLYEFNPSSGFKYLLITPPDEQ